LRMLSIILIPRNAPFLSHKLDRCETLHKVKRRTNKDRLCEERTTILSIGWTSPAREQGLIYKQISFFECKAVEVRVGRVLFLGRAKALAFKEAKRMWSYIMKMVYSPVTE